MKISVFSDIILIIIGDYIHCVNKKLVSSKHRQRVLLDAPEHRHIALNTPFTYPPENTQDTLHDYLNNTYLASLYCVRRLDDLTNRGNS